MKAIYEIEIFGLSKFNLNSHKVKLKWVMELKSLGSTSFIKTKKCYKFEEGLRISILDPCKLFNGWYSLKCHAYFSVILPLNKTTFWKSKILLSSFKHSFHSVYAVDSVTIYGFKDWLQRSCSIKNGKRISQNYYSAW